MPDPAAPDALPGRYADVQLLGEGAFGRVWRAVRDGEVVAVKVLAAELAHRPDAAWQFDAEFRTLARLAHPAFPRAVEAGRTPDHRPYYAMALVPGAPPDPPWPAARVRQAVEAIADALDHMHALGLVHGDLKPENLRIEPDGALRILDVGLTAPAGQPRTAVSGTLEYLAPEVLRKAPVAPAADLYALGCAAYELWTGAPPYGGGPAELVRAHLGAPVPAIPAAADDPALAALVADLLAKDPAARPASAVHVLAALGHDVDPARLAGPGRALAREAFIGRDDARRAWDAALAGDGDARGVQLDAAPGLGKSRTLDELRLAAQLAGRTWLGVGCAEAGEAPDAAMRVIVAQALAAAGRPAASPLAEWLAGETPAALADLEPAARRAALHGAAAEALVDAAGALGPLAVGLDDWHRADTGSRQLLALALRRAAEAPIAWALALDAAEEPAAPPAGLTAVALAPFGPAEVAALVAARLGGPAPDGLVEELVAAAAGSPRTLDLVLEHMVATGRLRADGGGWAYLAAAGGAGSASLDAIWAGRWADLGDAARRLAAAAAVAIAAGELPVPVLARVAGIPGDEVADALDRALAVGALEVSGGRARLAVPAAAGHFLGGLGAGRAGRWAAALARALIGGDAPGDAAGSPSRVDHVAGDDLARAARLALGGDDDALAHDLAAAAGRRALAAGTPREAAALLEAAQARTPADAGPAPRLGVALPLADALRMIDRQADAQAGYEAAIALAEAAGDRAAEARARVGLSKCRQLRNDLDGAIAAIEAADAAAEAAGDLALRARAATAAGRLWLFKGDPAAAEAWGERAIAHARAADAPAVLAQALNLRGYLAIARDLDAAAGALGLLEEGLAIARRLGDRVGEGMLLDNLGNARLALGDPRAAAGAFGAYVAISRALGLDAELVSARLNEAIALGEAGELRAAATAAAEAARGAAAANRKFPLSAARAVEGQVAWRAGRPADAAAPLDEALALAEAIGNMLVEEHVRLYRLDQALAMGDLPAARREAARVAELVAATGHAEAVVKLAVLDAERLRLSGDAPAAGLALAPARPSANRLAAHRAHQVAARLALAAGEAEAAVAAAGAALAVAEAWDAPWHLAEDHALLGRARLLAADADGAIAAARAALLVPADDANPWARAAAAMLLLDAGAADEGRAALAEAAAALAPGLAALEPPARGRLLQAQDLAGLPLGGGGAAAAAGTIDPDALAAAVEAIATAPDEHAIVLAALDAVMALAAADRGYVLAYEDGQLRRAVTRGIDVARELADGFSTSIASKALFDAQPLYVQDARTDEAWQGAASVMALDLRTVVALPLATPDRLLGVLYTDRQAIDPVLGPADLTLLGTLATAAASAILRERARGAAEGDALRWELCAALGADLAVTQDAGARRDAVLDLALRVAGAARGYWLVADPAGGWAAANARAGGEPPRAARFAPDQISRGVADAVAASGRGLGILDLGSGEEWRARASVQALGLRTVWCLPAGTADGALLYLDTDAMPEGDPARRLPLLEALAAYAAPLL